MLVLGGIVFGAEQGQQDERQARPAVIESQCGQKVEPASHRH